MFGIHKAARELENFVINDLQIGTFVAQGEGYDEAESHDKLHAVVCKLMARSPVYADKIHFDLTGSSVHTADWPLGSDLVPKNLPPQDLSLERKCQ